MSEMRFSSGDQEFGLLQENLAATFSQDTLALPICQRAADRKNSDVCSSRQIFVANVKLDSLGTSFTDPGGETHKQLSYASRRILRNEGDAGCHEPRNTLCDGN